MNVKIKEITEKDNKTLLYMANHQSLDFRYHAEVVVHGAIVQCSAGSHYRYLELPAGHGVEAMGMPAALESDCIPGKNIADFGICAKKTMMASSTEKFKYAAEFPGTIKEGALTYGIPCSFIPIGKWRETDNMLKVYNQDLLNQEGKVLISSKLLCVAGDIVDPKVFSGQGFLSGDDGDYLSDHDICKFTNQEGDPIQVEIVKNKITINTYIRYENADRSKKKLIKKGINKWARTYEYVYGHKAKVKVKINEVKGDDKEKKCIIFRCIDKEDCQAIEYDVKTVDREKNGKEKRTHMVETISGYNYGENRTIALYPIQAIGRYYIDGDPVRDKIDGHCYIDCRELTDIEYVNSVMHEFGHAMGLSEGGREISSKSHLFTIPGADGKSIMKTNEIMYTDYYGWSVSVSCIDIQMIIAAAKERKMQFYRTYNERVISKGVDTDGVIEACQRKEVE